MLMLMFWMIFLYGIWIIYKKKSKTPHAKEKYENKKCYSVKFVPSEYNFVHSFKFFSKYHIHFLILRVTNTFFFLLILKYILFLICDKILLHQRPTPNGDPNTLTLCIYDYVLQ